MTDLTDWDDDILGEDETDDDMIELVDIVDKGPGDENKEQIIELTEIAEEESLDLSLDGGEEENLDLNLEMPGEDNLEVEENLELADNEFADQGLSLETEDTESLVVPVVEASSSEDLTISQEQLETVLERVIEKKFADKIEKILFEVLEKVIEREIAEIKDSLQKDLDHIGNA